MKRPSRREDQRACGAVETAHDRIVIVDVLRGFSIFGILIVNMLYFSGPYYGPQFPGIIEARAGGQLDLLVLYFIRLTAEGKFLSMFSFLFGLSFTLQMTSVEKKGRDFGSLFRRRLFILLLIGLGHAFLLSAGDVLVQYALLGFLLLLFRKSTPQTLLVWAAISLSILLLVSIGSLLAPEPPAVFINQLVERSLRVYAHGTWPAILAQRAIDVGFYYLGVIFYSGYLIFAMFLLGAYAGRTRLFHDVEAHARLFRKIAWWGFSLGGVGSIASIAADLTHAGTHSSLHIVATILLTVGIPALSLGYISVISLLFRRELWQVLLLPLAKVGRMALSNYLFQSVVCNLLFYSYGLGLYGRISLKFGLLLSVLIFLVQIPLSAWWLKHFRFGPAEWLWRSLTYGKPQRLAT